MLFAEIVITLAAFLVLFYTGFLAVRHMIVLGKGVQASRKHTESKVMDILKEADSAQRRALSINGSKDKLLRELDRLKVTMAKMLIIVKAAQEARERLFRWLGYVGI